VDADLVASRRRMWRLMFEFEAPESSVVAVVMDVGWRLGMVEVGSATALSPVMGLLPSDSYTPLAMTRLFLSYDS